MPKRVLVADDSLTIQRAFAMVFGGQDVSLATARSVDDALSTARSMRPDLVIADAALGNGSGYDLCASLRNDAGLRGVPVFILASAHVPYDESRGQRVGATGSMLKPFESQQMIDQVTAALARTDGRPAAAAAASAPAAVAAAAPAPVAAPVRAHAPAAHAPAPPPPVVHAPPPAHLPPAHEPPAYAPPARVQPPARPAPAAPLPVAARADLTERVDARRIPSADDDDYGEFTIERSPGSGRPVPASLRAPAPARPAPVAPSSAPSSLRPSLIPGIRPGAPLPVRVPGAVSPMSAAAGEGGASAAQMRQAPNRTIMGLPAMAPPRHAPPAPAPAPAPEPLPPSRPAPPVARSVPDTVRPSPAPSVTPPVPSFSPPPPVAAAPAPAPAAPSFAPSPASSAAVSAAVSSAVAQKMAAISARGPEYEAIAKLSREVIEQVVWEIVPELAEVIIRQEVDRLANAKR